MSRKEKRLKASDVFAQTDFFMMEKTSEFSKAFPNIEKVEIVVLESGDGVSDFTKKRVYTESNLPGEYIDCHNPLCYNGGIDIGQMLRFMAEANETEKEERFSCQGYEGSPKGRINRGPCWNRFDVKIKIVFKLTEPQQRESNS